MIIADAIAKAAEQLAETHQEPLRTLYWQQTKGHHKKRRVRPPYKGIWKSNPVRNLYRADIWWLAK